MKNSPFRAQESYTWWKLVEDVERFDCHIGALYEFLPCKDLQESRFAGLVES